MPRNRRSGYEVGYGKPPARTRFKPGQSGNPMGRPKQAKTLATFLKAACMERVTVTENGQRRTVSKLQVIATQLVNKAAGGDFTPMKILLQALAPIEEETNKQAASEPELDADDEQVMKLIMDRLQGFKEKEKS